MDRAMMDKCGMACRARSCWFSFGSACKGSKSALLIKLFPAFDLDIEIVHDNLSGA